MVMRNRHEGGGRSGWWDDLPPGIRDRFRSPGDDETVEDPALRLAPPAVDEDPPPARRSRFAWLREAGPLALVFLGIAAAEMLFLLVCLSFLSGSSLGLRAW